jgi:hypothetical protein
MYLNAPLPRTRITYLVKATYQCDLCYEHASRTDNGKHGDISTLEALREHLAFGVHAEQLRLEALR